MKKILAVAGAALLLLCAAPRAGAQSWKKQQEPTVRSVQGIVTDHAGKPVAGAVVYLKDTKTLQIRSFITKEDGGYAFHGISINVDYELKAEHEGAKSDTRTLSVFDSRKEPVMDLKLKKTS